MSEQAMTLRKDMPVEFYLFDVLGAYAVKMNGTISGAEDIYEISSECKKEIVRSMMYHIQADKERAVREVGEKIKDETIRVEGGNLWLPKGIIDGIIEQAVTKEQG